MTLFEIVRIYLNYWKKTTKIDRLNNDLLFLNREINSILNITLSTEKNEYTKGFIEHCYRKIEDLKEKRERLYIKLFKLTGCKEV